MIILFFLVCLVVGVLIFLMFLVLKRTVRIVNDQTKSYFVNKLQGYDDLIQDKEKKLNEINELIKNKEIGKEENKKTNGNGEFKFDTDVIDLFNSTDYQNQNIFELNRKIDESFVVNYEDLIRDFLNFCNDSKDYEFCLKLREKFDSETIFQFKSMLPSEQEKEISKLLSKREYKVYDAFKLIINDDTIDNFLIYLDQLVEINSPKVLILVGNKNENYDYLSRNIETKYSEAIYRGIKIIYRGRVYDFSLSERNV